MLLRSDDSDVSNECKEIRDGTPDRAPLFVQSIAKVMRSTSGSVSADPQASMPPVDSVVSASRSSRPYGSVLSALAERSATLGCSADKPVCASVVVPALAGPPAGNIAPVSCLLVSNADTPAAAPAPAADAKK